jgi:rhodanese-related sulfurtransferase
MSSRSRFKLVLIVASLCGCASLGASHVAIGVVAPEVPVALELAYTNHSKSPVKLGDIKTSCECLQVVKIPVADVGPDQTISVPFIYKGTKPGRVEITVLVLGPGQDQVLDNSTVSGFVADPSWSVTPAELLAQKESAVVMIDTRRAEQYQEAHLARAINLPLFALKTRSDLRNQAVVLIDNGATPDALLGEVRKLRAQGFVNVRMLQGGVVGWSRQGGLLEGTHAGIRHKLATLMPAEVAGARRSAPWQIVEASHAEDLLAVLAASPGSMGPIGIIAADEGAYARIEPLLPKGQTRPVFYLAGGKAAWATYQAGQAALAAHTNQTFQVKNSSLRPVISGGCGSCGKK